MKKVWTVDNEIFYNARAAADYVVDHASDDYFDNLLDECYGEISICGYSYPASLALYRIDETAYRCGRCDWADAEAEELTYELEEMENEDELNAYDFTIRFHSTEVA